MPLSFNTTRRQEEKKTKQEMRQEEFKEIAIYILVSYEDLPIPITSRSTPEISSLQSFGPGGERKGKNKKHKRKKTVCIRDVNHAFPLWINLCSVEGRRHEVSPYLKSEALANNGTWVLLRPSPNYNIIVFQWVYQIQRHSDGSISRYKARLVSKGYNQKG